MEAGEEIKGDSVRKERMCRMSIAMVWFKVADLASTRHAGPYLSILTEGTDEMVNLNHGSRL